TALCLDEIFEALLGVALEKRGALKRTELGADAYFLKAVEHGLAEVGVGGIAIVVACVEALGVARFRQERARFGGIVGRGRRRPEKLETIRDDAAGSSGVAERNRLVDGCAVDGEARGKANARIVPR